MEGVLECLPFGEWVAHVFNHPVGKKHWYFRIDAPVWRPLRTCRSSTRRGCSPTRSRPSRKFDDAQLCSGFWREHARNVPYNRGSLQAEGERSMPRASKKRRPVKLWAASDLKILKSRAGKDSVEKIAKDLKRTPSAVRQKATSLGISLRARSR